MGAAVSTLPALAASTATIASAFRSPGPNPTIQVIMNRPQDEAAIREAQQRAQEAKELAERVRQEAREEYQHTMERLEEVNEGSSRAREEAHKMMMEMLKAERAAMRARVEAETATQAGRADDMRLAEQAARERERAGKMQERARRAEEAAKEEAKRAKTIAKEERRKANTARTKAQKAVQTAKEKVKQAISTKEEIEERWKEGSQPIVTPSVAELAAAKRRIQYKEGLLHFAVAGVSGGGKSSLINAFRGLRSREAGAATVGVTETTHVLCRYPDPNPQHSLVWYDIPGAGTLQIPDWQYFNAQGLYVFDCIIVLFDNRFTMTDVAILSNCARFDIPAYIVRSKADQHIRNVMKEMGYDSDDKHGNAGLRDRLYSEARQHFIGETRKNVKSNLEGANLPNRRVYIVSNDALLSIVKGEAPKKAIDETELLRDIVNQTLARRRMVRRHPHRPDRRVL
ncbi:interferon-inducible GTPase-domain-containing protein [Pisolithus orientalis]|uniref:interferon-inducible GTPase-domain-containing protein n=1 Tax=Pisolithus orientalis TaxID=936130 RepID=UPI002224A048|nr:interferon-inducible GTPase-domain-containing protein [Pisolithus orientalis]KAI6034847.1 interferon-inducible GTPase-domain-containing protein [Pisolithus orientalis]